MTFTNHAHAGEGGTGHGSRTDSSSGLISSSMTPTEEVEEYNDNEPVFLEEPQCHLSGGLHNDSNFMRIYSTTGWRDGNRSREEDIYEDLCYVNLRVGRRDTIDDVAVGDADLQAKDDEFSCWISSMPAEKRDYCVRELIETEKNYIDALNMIIRHFVRPLKEVIDYKERRIIFLHIKELSEIHRFFHAELFKACTSQASLISPVFLQFKEKFVLYGSYCANLPRAQATLDELLNSGSSKSTDIIRNEVERCQQAANDGKFKLRDLLSLPMQRILKYHLLLSELIKHTSDSHEDFPGLKKAHAAMLDVGLYINEIKRDSETLQIISDIQRSIIDLEMPPNTELKDYGRILKDGEVKMRSYEVSKLKTRYIFIFDKVMLMCKPVRGDQYSYREALILADYRVGEIPSSGGGGGGPFLHSREKDHGFFLSHRNEAKIVYGFFVKSEESKKSWVEALHRAHSNVHPETASLSDHTFTLTTFPNPSSCHSCGNLLHGLFFQGYRCTICKVSVHKGCLSRVRGCGAPHLPPRPPMFGAISMGASGCSATSSPSMVGFDGRSSANTFFQDFNNTITSSSPPPSPSLSVTQQSSVSQPLDDLPWFVGSMSREAAQEILEKKPHGTFLVRISPKQKGHSYAMSINFNGVVKHMRICQGSSLDGNLVDHYYLSSSRYFKSVPELVSWYHDHTLADSFQGLNVCLMFPVCYETEEKFPRIPSGQESERPPNSPTYSVSSIAEGQGPKLGGGLTPLSLPTSTAAPSQPTTPTSESPNSCLSPPPPPSQVVVDQ